MGSALSFPSQGELGCPALGETWNANSPLSALQSARPQRRKDSSSLPSLCVHQQRRPVLERRAGSAPGAFPALSASGRSGVPIPLQWEAWGPWPPVQGTGAASWGFRGLLLPLRLRAGRDSRAGCNNNAWTGPLAGQEGPAARETERSLCVTNIY